MNHRRLCRTRLNQIQNLVFLSSVFTVSFAKNNPTLFPPPEGEGLGCGCCCLSEPVSSLSLVAAAGLFLVAGPAEFRGRHPQEVSEPVAVRVMTGRAGDLSLKEGKARDGHGGDDIDDMLAGSRPLGMTFRAELRDRFSELSARRAVVRQVAEAAVLLALRETVPRRASRARGPQACRCGKDDDESKEPVMRSPAFRLYHSSSIHIMNGITDGRGCQAMG